MTPWQADTALGPYVLVSSIGEGGMGEVWKARDMRLNRIVAVKRLKGEHSTRFEQEARAIAALNHPHICQIYDVGPDYLVMEYVDGAPVRGPLSAEDAVRLALQIADALEEAHARGILHRDLKPANILVTGKGAKLLDFGLAKSIANNDATQTVEGTVMGTPAYMAPEQAEGKPVDARSDVFSFGAVLYEMLSGRRAFEGLASVLRDDPAPLQTQSGLSRIVTRCLRKAPAERFQTIAEVRAALAGQAGSSSHSPSIAVLPFDNLSADKENEYFSDGLAEEIINALTHVPGLKVIARTSAFAFKGKHEDIRRIADTLGVANILEGSVRRAGNRIRVTAQLITAADGSHLWSERYDREMADVFAIQDEIAGAIAAALRVRLSGKPHYVPKLPAYEALLRGRHHRQKFTPEAHIRSKECFQQAIALDPEYAAPHAELGLNYLLLATNGVGLMRDVPPLIRAEAQKALELDPSETNPYFLLGVVAAAHDYDWAGAARQFQMAMSSPSVSAETHWAYASFYLGALGRYRESVAEMRRAIEQDPLNVTWRAVLGSHLNSSELYDAAREELVKALEIDENHWSPNYILGGNYMATGNFGEAVVVGEKAFRANPQHSMTSGLLAAALVRVGEKDRAAEILREMGDSPKPIWGRVEYHLRCSEIDAAADWYEKMIEQREPFAVIFGHASICKELRQSPRWPKLAKLMNLPEAP
jgi:eukaryotic-like serine/threonine-protein kinase